MIKMVSRKNLRKGIAGLVAGLIAAIALLVIALPVMMQYQQHVTKSYHIKEYATMLEEQKELEEKGLAACYEPSTGIISINNTLGRPVIIVLAYASDGTNEEVKYYQPGTLVIAPGINVLHINDNLGFTLDPREVKIIKLVTSRGTIIRPPFCREIVKVVSVTYEQVVEYIVRRLQGFPVNLYLGEEHIPGGLGSVLIGKVYAHGYIDYEYNNTLDLIIINGTTVPYNFVIPFVGYANLAFFMTVDITGFTITRSDVGDYIALVYSPIPTINTDTYGCYNAICTRFGSLSDPLEVTIYRFAYNYVSKYADGDAPDPEVDPLNYTLINSGYDYIIVGTETSEFDPAKDFDSAPSTFYYNATIYISKNKVSNVQDADIVVKYSIRHDSLGLARWDPTVEYVTINVNGETYNAKAFYRIHYLGFDSKHVDQFVVYVPIEQLLNVKAGDSIWIYVEASFYTDSVKLYDTSNDWIEYTYTPLKQIVDNWYSQYFGG
ncbi:MAG: hypothetical protein DRJ43_06930 [Thermoprotei archaeon]|nr:MAG: hypothetical protein DRJ43_06930 [Thermoprotei archaeon]